MSMHDIDDGIEYGSVVRNNLMKRPFYKPYCGREGSCSGSWPRMIFTNDQFECSSCGYRTNFEPSFIAEYRLRAKKLEASVPADKRSQLSFQSIF